MDLKQALEIFNIIVTVQNTKSLIVRFRLAGQTQLLNYYYCVVTVSRRDGSVYAPLAQSFGGQKQLLLQFADVTVGLGLHDAQLRVDVLIFISGIFLVLLGDRVNDLMSEG